MKKTIFLHCTHTEKIKNKMSGIANYTLIRNETTKQTFFELIIKKKIKLAETIRAKISANLTKHFLSSIFD